MGDCKENAGTKSLPAPPFVLVSGIPNFRDLGGYAVTSSSPPSRSSHSIRTRYIYRCGEPSEVTVDGIEVLRSLGITYVYDLRSNAEIERSIASGKKAIVVWESSERIFAPVFTDEDYSPQSLAVRFRNYAKEGSEVTSLSDCVDEDC